MPIPAAAALLPLLTLALAGPPADGTAERPLRGSVVVRVQAQTVRELQAALALTDDLWSHAAGLGTFDMRVTPAQRAALVAAGVRHEVLIADLEERIDAERVRLATPPEGQVADDSWFLDFKDLAAVYARLDQFAQSPPPLVQDVTVGTSFEGRPIRAIRISRAADPASAPAFVFNSCQHAREWATPMTTMYIADRLVSGAFTDPRIADLLQRAAVYVIPVVNPDGYAFSWASSANRLWRKNRQPNADGSVGTDLNRNWGYGWGGVGASASPGNDTYRGPSAFSAPESAAMRDFYAARPQVLASIDFHSYSQLLLWPWGWTDALCPDHATHAAVGAAMQDAIAASDGRDYVAGPIYSTIYPASGGSVDWTYGDQGVISYTIEVRDTGAYGFVMPPEEILPNARENWEGALAMMEATLNPAIVAPNGDLPSQVEAGQPTTVSIVVTPTTGTVLGATLRARASGAAEFASIAMAAGAGTFTAQLPGVPCGQQVEYWFEVSCSNGTVRYPSGAPGTFLSALALERTVTFEDTFDAAGAAAWTVGAADDNATAGLWTLVDPVGTTAQPENDRTPAPGVRCWVTGQGAVGGAAGAADVDGGTTTLVSPVLDGSDLAATLVYFRWYSNDQGGAPASDSMPVEWSRDGTAWAVLETVTENANAWVEVRRTLSTFLPSPGPFRIRFRARDLGTGSLVEAGVDDVRIEKAGCSWAPGDLNRDGSVDGADLGLLLADWGSPRFPDADINRDGTVNGADLGILLSNWTP